LRFKKLLHLLDHNMPGEFPRTIRQRWLQLYPKDHPIHLVQGQIPDPDLPPIKATRGRLPPDSTRLRTLPPRISSSRSAQSFSDIIAEELHRIAEEDRDRRQREFRRRT